MLCSVQMEFVSGTTTQTGVPTERGPERSVAGMKLEEYADRKGRQLFDLGVGTGPGWGMVPFTLFWKESVPVAVVLDFLEEKCPGVWKKEIRRTDLVVSAFEMECDCGAEKRSVTCSVRAETMDHDCLVQVRQDVVCRSRNLRCGKVVAFFWISPEEQCPREMEKCPEKGRILVDGKQWYFWRK